MHPHDERPYSFCPMCGGASRPRLLRPHEPERLVCTRCGFVFYLDPKVAVGTIIRDERHHRAGAPRHRARLRAVGVSGRLRGPWRRGGRGGVREAREEAGLEIRLDHLINVYSYPSRAPVIIVYAATAIGGCLACDEESLGRGRFFAPDEIPGTSSRSGARTRRCARLHRGGRP